MDDLTAQHDTLAEATKSITNVFRDVVEGGGIYLREELVRDGRSMCTCYYQHLEWEEANFFPVLERTLFDEDWNKIEEDFKAVDPLDSSPVDDHYRALFLAISDGNS
jgi:hemerythrin-like domain-containing protein